MGEERRKKLESVEDKVAAAREAKVDLKQRTAQHQKLVAARKFGFLRKNAEKVRSARRHA